MTQDGSYEAGNADPPVDHAGSGAATDSLRQAMRRARQENAERAGVLDDLRAARVGRLELLRDALDPLVAQIPPDIDIFDIALVPGDNPRLFIDMIGFVEMGRDARLYRLLQDSRHGRLEIAESDHVGPMVEAVTEYVARRILERDKALASDGAWRATPVRLPARLPACFAAPAEAAAGDTGGPSPKQASDAPPGASGVRVLSWLGLGLAFVIDLLGAIALVALLALGAWYLLNGFNAPF